MGRRQFHIGEESQGGNFGNKGRATEKRSPIGLYFQLNSPNNFSVNWSVVDSNHCTWSCYVLKKHSRITWCKLTNWVAAFIFERRNGLNNGMRTGGTFRAPLLARNSRFALASRSPRFRLYSPKIRKKFRLFCTEATKGGLWAVGPRDVRHEDVRTLQDAVPLA